MASYILPVPFASDELYPAGAQTWSGQPTKKEPSLAEIKQGFVPGHQIPCEYLNYLFSQSSGGNAAQIHRALRSWKTTKVAPDPGTYEPGGYNGTLNRSAGFAVAPLHVPAVTEPLLFSTTPGVSARTSNFLISPEGCFWTSIGDALGTYSSSLVSPFPLECVGSKTGRIMLTMQGSTSLLVNESALSPAANWFAQPNGANFCTAMHFCEGNHRLWCGFVGDTLNLRYTDDYGVNGFNKTLPLAGAFDYVSAITSDPTGQYLMVAISPGGAGGNTIYVSTDFGANWTSIALTLTVPTNIGFHPSYGITYNEHYGQFFILGNNGFATVRKTEIATLANYTYFYSYAGLQFGLLNAHGVLAWGRHVASIGPVIAVLAAPTVPARSGTQDWKRAGVYYTFDMGLSWFFTGFSTFVSSTATDIGAGVHPHTLKAIGGKFVAIGSGVIYQTQDLGLLLPSPDHSYASNIPPPGEF